MCKPLSLTHMGNLDLINVQIIVPNSLEKSILSLFQN